MKRLFIFDLPSGCAFGPVKLTVNVGDLLNITVDAIMVGVGADFEMTGRERDQCVWLNKYGYLCVCVCVCVLCIYLPLHN